MVKDLDEKSNDDTKVDSDAVKMETMLEKFDYEIARWIALADLKRQTKAVNDEVERHEKLQNITNASIFGDLSEYIMGGNAVVREKQSLLVDEYWQSVSIESKYKGLSKQQIKGILVLQSTFRTWITLRKCRDRLRSRAKAVADSFGDDKAVATSLYIQSTIKRVIAKSTVEAKIAANVERDKSFARFCSLMSEGVMVTMFSRKYGNAPSRKICLDSGYNNLTFTTSLGTRGKIPIKSIYKIHKGISETMYPHARKAVLNRCICLECLGDRVVDMELNSAQQARDMYHGFERLILLSYGTASPFYVDNFGIPRRAGPSIIESALMDNDDEGSDKIAYRSKPDEMRFWSSIRLLQQEYDIWQSEQDAERRAHNLLKEAEAEKVANRLKPSEDGKGVLSMDGDQKSLKLVRFTGQDGASIMMTENCEVKQDVRDLDPPLSADIEATNRGKGEKLTGKFRSGSEVSSSSTSSVVSVSNHDSRSVRKVIKSSPTVSSSNSANYPRVRVSPSSNPLWRAVLCFSPVHADPDDNGDYFLTGNAGDDESSMSCGDHYQSSVYDSYNSDDDEEEEEVEGESSASDDNSSNSSESSAETSGSEDETSDADSC